MTRTAMHTRAISIGTEAARTLEAGARGQVAAVFRNAIYVRFRDDWACLGGPALGRGPLNIPCEGAPGDWREASGIGSSALVQAGALHLSGRLITLRHAPVWAPAPCPPWTPGSRARGLEVLYRALPPGVPEDGLARLIRPGAVPRSPVERAAWPAVRKLTRWISRCARSAGQPPEDAVGAFLGLGPGLTPSGDDFLAGMLVALRLVGMEPRRHALSHTISTQAGRLTSALSAAHLHAAAWAGLNEELEDLLGAVLAGKSVLIELGISRLSARPHHSPWDALAGAATAFRGSIPGAAPGFAASRHGKVAVP